MCVTNVRIELFKENTHKIFVFLTKWKSNSQSLSLIWFIEKVLRNNAFKARKLEVIYNLVNEPVWKTSLDISLPNFNNLLVKCVRDNKSAV